MKNRIIYAPFEISHHAPLGIAGMENIISYEQRAQSGAGLLVHGESIVHPSGNSNACPRNLYDEKVLPNIFKETALARRHGALSSVSLCHHGGRTDPDYTPDKKMYGPSEVISMPYNLPVTPLDEEMIQTLVDAYASAALMAKTGGYDMVTIHGAHGFLPSQFLSPRYNHRTDRFGGSLENRARFPLMIVEAIKKTCGADYPIEYRFSGDDFMENGSHLDEMVEFARMLDGKVEIIHVSAASFWDYDRLPRIFPSEFLPHGVNVYMASAIKKAVKHTPVATVGALTADLMEQVIANGDADLVAAARWFWADPYWPDKLRKGQDDDVTPCVRCNLCISTVFYPYVPFVLGIGHCTVNPQIGREWESKFLEPAPTPRKVLIAGGGPGGMQAAITASDRGHQVVLCDDRDALGGGLHDLLGPRFKEDYRGYLEVMQRRVAKRPIEVRLNTRVTPELARSIGADMVIAAVGATPVTPPIPGVDDRRVITLKELRTAPVGQRVVVIGGGPAGAEEGLHLRDEGRDVTVIEQRDEVGIGAPYLHYQSLKLEYRKDDAPRLVTGSQVLRITAEGVWARDKDGKETVYPADTILLACGMAARREEAESLRDCAEDFRLIGDCRHAATIYEAVRDGYDVAMGIGSARG